MNPGVSHLGQSCPSCFIFWKKNWENSNSFGEGGRDETITKLTPDQPLSLAVFWSDSSFVLCFATRSALLGNEKPILSMPPRLSSSGISSRKRVLMRAGCDLVSWKQFQAWLISTQVHDWRNLGSWGCEGSSALTQPGWFTYFDRGVASQRRRGNRSVVSSDILFSPDQGNLVEWNVIFSASGGNSSCR